MKKIMQFSIPFIVACLMIGMSIYLAGVSSHATAAPSQSTPVGAILVTTLEDELISDGDCSLREAIQAANTNSYVDDCGTGDVLTDTITFDVEGTITVTNQLSVTASGPLVIDGGNVISTSGGGTTRVWWIETASILTLQRITIANGYVVDDGGGLYNQGSNVTLTNITFTNNQARMGGGMVNDANSSASLMRVIFNGNQTNFDGGSLYNQGEATLTDTIFSNNQTYYDGGGMVNNGGNVLLTNVTFSNNSTTEYYSSGGGMVNANEGFAKLTNVTFSGNSAETGGGGMHNSYGDAKLEDVTFTGNVNTYAGGGMSILGGLVEYTNVTFIDNYAGVMGGGLFESGTLNSSKYTNVTFSSNQAVQAGGGIYYDESYPTLTNITFSGNSATYGGGIYNHRSSPTLTNVTFFDNSAVLNGGGIYNIEYYGTGSHPILINTILWGNSPDQIFLADLSSATVTYSDIQGGWDGVGNIDSDPRLGPLQDNGGSTLTHALAWNSPAIDTGDNDQCPTTDQRGVIRPLDGNGDGKVVCDIGAYEKVYQPLVLLPLVLK
jgi:CSLREA domain-containing protein